MRPSVDLVPASRKLLCHRRAHGLEDGRDLRSEALAEVLERKGGRRGSYGWYRREMRHGLSGVEWARASRA